MADLNLNPASQQWGREVTASIGKVDAALTAAQGAARLSDSALQVSISRTAVLVRQAEDVSGYLLTLQVVRNESRTNAIGV